MPLPILNQIKDSVGGSAKKRSSALVNSISNKIDPRKLASRSLDTVKGKILSEVPESGMIGGVVSDFIGDFATSFNQSRKEELQEEKQQTQKLERIQDNTFDTTDTLLEVLKVVDYRLFQQLEADRERLDELRTITGISAETNHISNEQLEMLREANKLKLREDKKSRFSKQKDSSKVSSVNPIQSKTTDKKKRKGLLAFLEGTFLGRLLTGFGKLLAPLLALVGGRELVSQVSKFVPNLVGDPSGTFRDKQGKLRDKKTGQYTSVEKVKSERKAGKARKKGSVGKSLGKGFAKIAPAAKGVGKAFGWVGLALMIIDGLVGGIKAGVESYSKGNNASKVIADGLTGAFVAIVESIPDILNAIFIQLPKLLGGVVIEVLKNVPGLLSDFGQYMDKNVTKPAANALRNAVKSAFDFVTDSIVKSLQFMKSAAMNMVKSLINTVVDKTRTRALLPESIKTFLSTPEPVPQMGELSPQSKSSQSAASILTGQKSISDFTLDRMIYSGGAGNQNITAAPITTNVQNNNVFPGSIKTRNPDSPVFYKS